MAKESRFKAAAGRFLTKTVSLKGKKQAAAASELTISVKTERVSKALAVGSKKAGTFESKNARKRA